MSEPTMLCPRCGQQYDDLDGFGVLHCEHCGFCTHASMTDGRCDLCGYPHEQQETPEVAQL